jgi:hypothetical protein
LIIESAGRSFHHFAGMLFFDPLKAAHKEHLRYGKNQDQH